MLSLAMQCNLRHAFTDGEHAKLLNGGLAYLDDDSKDSERERRSFPPAIPASVEKRKLYISKIRSVMHATRTP